MNTQTQEALKMAIEWIENAPLEAYSSKGYTQEKTIQACKEALKPNPNCDEACMYQCEMEKKHEMTYEQGFAHGYEAHRVEQENEKQQSIINIWDEICELEQPAQEPVNNCPNCNSWFTKEIHSIPAPSWQGLSDDRIRDIGDNCLENNNGLFNWIDFARAIEQELKEKNNG